MLRSSWHLTALLLAAHVCVVQGLRMGGAGPKMAGTAATYDLVVVGGGSAGLEAAKFAATFGKRAVIVEKAKLGGDCTWTGCVPSKTLLGAAKAAHAVRTANAKWGITNAPSEVQVDFVKVMARVAEARSLIYEKDDAPEVMKAQGVETIEGTATFITPTTLSVALPDGSTTTLEAAAGVLVATGAGPKIPSIEGLSSVPYLTYEQIFDLKAVPPSLTVVGGGPIGCELAQAFARLGSRVTICASRLLPTLDPEAGEALAAALRDEGVTIVEGRATSVSSGASGGHVLQCGGQSVSGSTLLVAAGRQAFTSGLGLETIGVEIEKATGGIMVDDQLRTSVSGVYAAGDCTGDVQFTHYAGFQGASAAANALLPIILKGVEKRVPGCTFTSPEVAHIGLTAQAAIAEHGEKKVRVERVGLEGVDRAVCEGEQKHGFLQIVTLKNGEILGATFVSPTAGELIGEMSLAMSQKVKLPKLASTMHAYPSYGLPIQSPLAKNVYYESLAGLAPLLKWVARLKIKIPF